MSLFGKPVGHLWNITVNIVAAQPKETDNHMLSGYSFLTIYQGISPGVTTTLLINKPL